MINLEKKTSQPVKAEMHYKMYKDGKKLVTAGITTLMFSGFVLGTQTTAHADTTSDTSSDGGQAQATTGGNAVTQTTAASAASATTATTQTAAAAASTATASQAGTITQPVNVDSSALDQAVDAAKQAGLKVTPQPTTSSTVAPSEVDSAKAQIESDYASQAAKLNEATEQQETVNHYNDSKGDTTALDEAVKKAQSTPGLSVKQGETKTTTKSADDKSGIANWEKSTASDYASQVDAINKAIDAQKQKNDDYQQKLKDYSNYLNGNSTLDPTKVMQGLHLNATAESSNVEELQKPDKSVSFNGFIERWYNSDRPGAFLRTTYYNPAQSYYVDFEGKVHNIGKVVVTYSDLVVGPQSNQWNSTEFSVSPIEIGVIDSFYLKSVTATYDFYDENGNYINFEPGSAWVFLSSLGRWSDWNDSSKTNNPAYDHVEGVQGVSGIKMYDIPNGGAVVHNGNNAYPDSGQQYESDGKTEFNNPYDNQQGAVIGYISNGLKLRWNLDQNYPPVDNGIGHSLRYEDGQKKEDAYDGGWYYWRFVQSYNGFEILQPPTSSVSYHYNVLKVTPNGSADDLSYQYHNLNVTTTPDKNWTQGDQVVTGKTEIAGDVATATISMNYAKPSDSKESMSKLSVTDNYSQMVQYVTYQGAQVYENDQLATDQYNIVNDAKTGTVTATRKDASKAPGGSIKLVVDFKINENTPSGTKLINGGSATINNETATTPEVPVNTYDQTANKHWVEGSQTVDDKTYINDDVITTKVDMSLPDPSTLAHSLTNVTIDDNYTDFANKAKLQSYRVEENGNDVTDQYTVTNKDGHLTAVRKDASTAPAGTVSLIATWLINSDVASGTTFTNAGSGRINNHTVDTNTPIVKTYEQTANKHWVEGSQTVDDKTYINDDTIQARVEMSLPNKSDLAKPLTDVTLVDDYSEFQKNVTYQSAQVIENGKDATSQYTITNVGGKITAMRKTPGDSPAGNVQLLVNFKINDGVASGTTFTNRGSGRINNHTVNTNNAKVVTYVQSTDKHWTEGSQDVDGKVYVSGDEAQADVSMSLPDPSALAKALTKVEVVDDYSSFADKVDYKDAKVYENGVDATSEYTIVNKDGKVTATRKDASKAPKGTVDLHVTWTIHSDVENGTELTNNGSGTINSETVKTPSRKVTVYTQDADKHWVEGDQTVDNKTYVDGDEAHGRVTMSLPDPSTLAKPLSDVTLVDDYTDFMDKVTYESAQVIENGKDMTAEYIITNVNGKVTAMRKDPSSAPAGNAQLLVNFKINDDVKSGTVLTNKGSGRINNKTVSTNEAKITVYTQDADKHWTEGSQTVDGEVFVDGAITHATVTTTLPDQSTLAKPLTDITITDDYSQFADKVDLQDVHVLENDKDVTDQYTITKQDGKVVATRKDASKAPAGKAQLVLTFKLHTDVESGTKLINKGSSMINKHTVSTNDATITTFKPNPKKDIVVSVDNTKSLNGSNIDLNSTFDYKLEGATLPMNSNALSEYGFHDDYDQAHDQYNGGYVVLLNTDVTLTDGTVLKKGTDVTKYTTQTIDQENGKVDIEFDSDFLAKVDRTKSEFGATAYLAMTRIKAGDVENKYTNTINGTEFTSNTVTSHTDEPKPTTPETPSTPKTETPTTPQSTTPETPIKTSQQPVFAAVQPATVAAERQATPQQALPQTGNDKDEALALTGLASLLFGLGTLGLKKRRRA